ncbi:triose-phosphate isomerase [Auritidibacter ignavus]|uniref:triose-phosphate isomerase n=1 Tax=Auritidibacter TaxID=1160973 RepID=UPI000D72DA29|nr:MULTISPECIES: triose-phosphate isomerase [Auritidibacter]PXA80394.1 triose-phosphate isomerase [Auritidibacter sp. NML120636]WGH82076.1 triose-phosphate isomerase [Auritidibacter ignavus]WGH91271.1 triose-phosphate isomerase [Auritidibacter ignavus]WHS27983.1 triose-phosphate isomerase [Auritidibacter ignavus]WHS34880.1 triose-phosphate isomerase [Auritidibacter ignavus]
MTSTTNGVYDRTPLMAGNWKMNLDHQQAVTLVQKLCWTLNDADHDFDTIEVAVFPPFTDLRSVQTLIRGDKLPVSLGAQDLSPHASGAYTGDISGQFLAKLDCRYVLVGHSERRSVHQESDEIVAAKVQAAFTHGLVPILCVGEDLQVREDHRHLEHTLGQVRAGIAKVPTQHVQDLVIAYEPVWAIGTGEVAGPEDAQEMASAIRELLSQDHGPEVARSVRILYGGSVKAANVASIMREKDVDGALVGGASLDEAEFASIVRFEHHLLTD